MQKMVPCNWFFACYRHPLPSWCPHLLLRHDDPRIIRLMRYLHVLRVLHSSSAGPNWAETGYKINDITWFVNVVAFLAPNSKTLSVLKLPLNLQPRWIDFVCQQRHRPWKSGVLCLAKCTSSSNYTWCLCTSLSTSKNSSNTSKKLIMYRTLTRPWPPKTGYSQAFEG